MGNTTTLSTKQSVSEAVKGEHQRRDIVHRAARQSLFHQLFRRVLQVSLRLQSSPHEIDGSLRGQDIPQPIRGEDEEFSHGRDDFRVQLGSDDDQPWLPALNLPIWSQESQ